MAKGSTKGPTTARNRDAPATSDDIQRILGHLDEAKLLEIIALHPTILDVEEASLWLAGDSDVYGAEPPLKGVASAIVTILTANEEEEPPRTR